MSTRKPQVAQVVTPDGEVTQVSPSNGKKFTLEELQGYVGGYIELIRLPNGRDMYVNEEGKLTGLALNPTATAVSGLWPHDVIIGPALVMGDRETWEKLYTRESSQIAVLSLIIWIDTGKMPTPNTRTTPATEDNFKFSS